MYRIFTIALAAFVIALVMTAQAATLTDKQKELLKWFDAASKTERETWFDSVTPIDRLTLAVAKAGRDVIRLSAMPPAADTEKKLQNALLVLTLSEAALADARAKPVKEREATFTPELMVMERLGVSTNGKVDYFVLHAPDGHVYRCVASGRNLSCFEGR